MKWEDKKNISILSLAIKSLGNYTVYKLQA